MMSAVVAGDYFLWFNPNAVPLTVEPDEGNENFWPLPDQQHVVPAKGWLALQVPEDAEDGQYTLMVTNANGTVCPQDAQPKLIIISGL